MQFWKYHPFFPKQPIKTIKCHLIRSDELLHSSSIVNTISRVIVGTTGTLCGSITWLSTRCLVFHISALKVEGNKAYVYHDGHVSLLGHFAHAKSPLCKRFIDFTHDSSTHTHMAIHMFNGAFGQTPVRSVQQEDIRIYAKMHFKRCLRRRRR